MVNSGVRSRRMVSTSFRSLVIVGLVTGPMLCFFFQAEDGIRDLTVTGDQTCALPISEGLVLAMVRTNEEFRREPQYTDVLSKMPLITVEKIGESDPVPLKANGDNLPLAGVRALGMGHVIAGAAIGRDMALYGADVLNIWRPRDSEIEAFAWDVQVGMRSTILDDAKEDREKFNQLLKDADVFFANKRPGFLKKHGLDAESLCAQKPGL